MTVVYDSKRCFVILFVMVICSQKAFAQSEYNFPLTQGFQSLENSNISLTELQNDDRQTGLFSNYTIPITTCSNNTETVGGYKFPKNAGLMFLNNGFINCEYSISFTFQIDSLLVRENREGSPGNDWVHLLSFEHINDHGIYIRINSGTEGTGTLDFWPHGVVGAPDFFNTSDLYQMTLVRNCSGIVRIFVNGTLFDAYDDSTHPEYLPGTVNDAVVFFRDRPTSVLNDEASAGFVRSIVISNSEWADAEIQGRSDNACNTLIDLSFTAQNTCLSDLTTFTINPDVSDADSILWDFGDPHSGSENFSTIENPTHTFSSEGVFQVAASVYFNGVEVSAKNDVTIENSPFIDLGNDTTLLPNDILVLDVTGLGDSYLWTDGSVNSTFTVTTAGTYGVTVTSSAGCPGFDAITVDFGEYEILIPNAFTPNGDAQNDFWIIEGLENFPDNEIFIYDRIGNFILSLPQYNNNWDGGALAEGTYFYRLNRGNGQKDFGSVSIIR